MPDIDFRAVAIRIAQELREHPERWIQGAWARDKNGTLCDWRSPDACRCLGGHVMYFAGEGVKRTTHQLNLAKRAEALFLRAARAAARCTDIASWNDAPARTVEDVIALCERVAADTAHV